MIIDNENYLKYEWWLPHHSKMQLVASDIETTGLLHMMKKQGDSAKLHNMGLIDIKSGRKKLYHAPNKEGMQKFLDKDNVVHLMHNGATFDKPALELLGYDVSKMRIIDTLAISWYLEPTRKIHGLAAYGEEFGIQKPAIDDWENQTQEEYDNRVMEDCKIQQMLWSRQYKELKAIYGSDEKVFEFIQFLMFKMHLQLTQQRNPWKLNIPECERHLEETEIKVQAKVVELEKVMPDIPQYVDKKRPKKCFKASSTPEKRVFSKLGLAYYKLANANGRSGDDDVTYTVRKVDAEGKPVSKPANAGSSQQVKAWLYGLGWVPETFEFKRDKETGDVREIPQVNLKNSGGKVCPSIEKLAKKYPEAGLEHLVGLGILKHRVTIFSGFLKNHVDGYIAAECNGFTNTLRLKHSKLVNLPSTRVLLGEEIRSLLETEEGQLDLGSDLSSLEDKCKFHFMMKYDPDYVRRMNVKGYDAHLAICVQGGMLTQEQVDAHKLYGSTDGAEGKDYSGIRHLGKGTNYSCQYGAGAAAVARSAGVELAVGKELHKAYWDLNWSIKTIAENTKVKEVMGKKWQYNPISGYWYWLKADKDRFSTLCQGLGAYIFDIWSMNTFYITQERFSKDPAYIAQFHDEYILGCKDSEKSKATWTDIVNEAIERTDKFCGLDVKLGCDIQYGNNYSEIH